MDITKYMKHLPTCNIMQDWSEAETAMADTPEKFRDHDWVVAREELNTKMGTCSCGLTEAKEVAKNISSKPMLTVSGCDHEAENGGDFWRCKKCGERLSD